MKAYSLDLREKIVACHIEEKVSIRKVAARFAVSKSLVEKLVLQHKREGNVEPKQPGKPRFSYLTNAESLVRTIVQENQDATLAELCELFAQRSGNWVSISAMHRKLQLLGLTLKKKRQKQSRNDTKSPKT